jgi:hypothetical protein
MFELKFFSRDVPKTAILSTFSTITDKLDDISIFLQIFSFIFLNSFISPTNKKICYRLGELKFIQKMRKPSFCTGSNTSTIIQFGYFFEKLRQISPGSQNMKLEGLLFSSAQTFKNYFIILLFFFQVL